MRTDTSSRFIKSAVTLVALAAVISAPCRGQDAPFQDSYPQLVWGPGYVTMAQPFIAMGMNIEDALSRGERAWRAWRGGDPDEPELWPDIAALHAEDARWQDKWDATNPVDLIAFAFEQEGHGFVGNPRELAEQAWMRMHHLIPTAAIPTRGAWISEHTTGALEYGLGRMMTVLSLSDEQVNATELAHQQFLELYGVFLEQLYDKFNETRAGLDERLGQDPVLRNPDGHKGYRRDRLRGDAFVATHGPGRRTSPAAYSGELQRELLAAWLEAQQAAEQARRDGFRRFIEHVGALLTDDQAAGLNAAENAYEIGRIVYGRQGAEIMPILFASVRVDARLLLDPEIEPAHTMPAHTTKLREALSESPLSRDVRLGIETELTRYEAAWLRDRAAARENRNDDQLAACYRRVVTPGFHFLFRDASDEQRDVGAFRDTLALQTRISDLLTNHDLEVAGMWRDATNRLVYPETYRRWDGLDIANEFDRVIDRAAEANVRESLVALLQTYQRERAATEDEMLRVTRAFAQVRLRTRPSAQESGVAAGPYLHFQTTQLERRRWFREQIELHLGS